MAKSSGTPRKSSARPSAAKKSAAKPRAAAKPQAKKAAAKSPAKPAKKTATARTASAAKAAKTTPKAAPAAARTAAKKAPAKPAASAPTPTTPAKSGPTLAPAARDNERGRAKAGRKGITIVDQKGAKKGKEKPSAVLNHPGPQLLSPGSPIRRPLIPSGPNAPARDNPFGGDQSQKPRKTPFNKRQLERYRQILLEKRAELIGDVSQMETEALQANSGSLSNLPQHMAEQGSDTYGQTLALDLAAADRRLIREIDDALARIEAGTYGICELTGRPIRPERLEELPWARYSIEAARELERRAGSSL